MQYTKRTFEEGVLKHFPEIEDAVLEFLWSKYCEDPKEAAANLHGLYWMRDYAKGYREE